jgi:thiamine biosynthesis lipoprotein
MDALISPRRRTLLAALASAPVLAACGDRSSLGTARPLEFRGPAMGSTYALKIAEPKLSVSAGETMHLAAQRALEAVERSMSTFEQGSELMRFNRHSAGAFALSEDLYAVFALANDIAKLTGGAFDVTVAPLVDAWGFGPSRNPRIVDEVERRALGLRVGYGQIELDPARRTATKQRGDVAADLSGIAKGYGVDRAALALDALGVRNYMVEAGGEVRTRGVNAAGRPWQIAIEQPDAMPQRPDFVVPLSNLAMATSGDYRNYFERDGRRYCHEIDPGHGRPIDNGVASVSVVAADCAYADAMATALIVMGEKRGLALASQLDLAAYFLVRDAGKLRAAASPAFVRLGGQRIA